MERLILGVWKLRSVDQAPIQAEIIDACLQKHAETIENDRHSKWHQCFFLSRQIIVQVPSWNIFKTSLPLQAHVPCSMGNMVPDCSYLNIQIFHQDDNPNYDFSTLSNRSPKFFILKYSLGFQKLLEAIENNAHKNVFIWVYVKKETVVSNSPIHLFWRLKRLLMAGVII